ncbi:hypothetical protein GGX14DRAFT_564200 [Mycena pura]|uniref:Uncharacterized protein n=1 Tax=Mycena pura TaxID=153505 RepID=A0AAD6VHM5_9AGAR|nr:hypothetical protein GGX14DRAFT_564200 [Mycena pura]
MCPDVSPTEACAARAEQKETDSARSDSPSERGSGLRGPRFWQGFLLPPTFYPRRSTLFLRIRPTSRPKTFLKAPLTLPASQDVNIFGAVASGGSDANSATNTTRTYSLTTTPSTSTPDILQPLSSTRVFYEAIEVTAEEQIAMGILPQGMVPNPFPRRPAFYSDQILTSPNRSITPPPATTKRRIADLFNSPSRAGKENQHGPKAKKGRHK